MRYPIAVALVLLALETAGPSPVAAAPLFIPRSEEGSWTAPDRQVHVAASIAIAASLRVEGRSRVQSVAGTFTIGMMKELYDVTLKPRRLGRGASRKDLAADLVGALAGVLIVAAVDR